MLWLVKEKCYIRPSMSRPDGGVEGDRLLDPDRPPAGHTQVLIGNGPGSCMRYDGPPAHFLEPMDEEAKEAAAAFYAEHPEQLTPNVMQKLPVQGWKTEEQLQAERDERFAQSLAAGIAQAMAQVVGQGSHRPAR